MREITSCDKGFFINKEGAVFKQLKLTPRNTGHLVLTLPIAGKYKTKQVHQLVMDAFVGEKPEGMVIRHLNGNPKDNRLENLKYGTRKENGEDAVEQGVSPKGERNGQHKLTMAQVQEIRAMQNVLPGTAIAYLYNVSTAAIYSIFTKKHWGWLDAI